MSANETIEPTITAPEQELETAQLGIEGMHCANCVARVERELHRVPGVQDATVSLAAEEARVTFAPAALGVAELEQAVERAGYQAHAKTEEATEDEFVRQDGDRAREHGMLMRKFWFSAAVPVLLLSDTMLVSRLRDVSWLEKGSEGLSWVLARPGRADLACA